MDQFACFLKCVMKYDRDSCIFWLCINKINGDLLNISCFIKVVHNRKVK